MILIYSLALPKFVKSESYLTLVYLVSNLIILKRFVFIGQLFVPENKLENADMLSGMLIG